MSKVGFTLLTPECRNFFAIWFDFTRRQCFVRLADSGNIAPLGAVGCASLKKIYSDLKIDF